jgi:hypothetical protein
VKKRPKMPLYDKYIDITAILLYNKGGKLINDAFGSIGNAVRKGVHPVVKKAATKTIKKAFRYTQKSFASGVIEGVSYSALEHFTSQFVNSLVGR